MDWTFHKVEGDYSLTTQKGNIKIWANVAPDYLAVSLNEYSEDSILGSSSYGKFLQVADLENAKNFIEALIQEMPSGSLDEASIYASSKLKDYGKDKGTL